MHRDAFVSHWRPLHPCLASPSSFYVILEESSILKVQFKKKKVQFNNFIMSPQSVPSTVPDAGLPVGLRQSPYPGGACEPARETEVAHNTGRESRGKEVVYVCIHGGGSYTATQRR